MLVKQRELANECTECQREKLSSLPACHHLVLRIIRRDKVNASHMDLKTGFPQSTEASLTALRHARTLTENTAVSSRVARLTESRGAVETALPGEWANPEPSERAHS